MKNKMSKIIVTLLAAVVVVTATNASFSTAAIKKKINVEVGKKVTLKVSGKGYVFKSADRKIATVNKKGVITGKRQGKTIVTAKRAKKPKKTYRFTVRVKRKAVSTSSAAPVVTSTPVTTPTAMPTPTATLEPGSRISL